MNGMKRSKESYFTIRSKTMHFRSIYKVRDLLTTIDKLQLVEILAQPCYTIDDTNGYINVVYIR